MKAVKIKEAATELGVSSIRVQKEIYQEHFPNVRKCECGHSWMIPIEDIYMNKKRKEQVKKRRIKLKKDQIND